MDPHVATEIAYKNGYAAGVKDTENKFYIVDAKTGENRGSVVMDDYDPYIGKYAFCEPTEEDKELDEAVREAHDNLVRSLIEAGGEIRELKEDKARLIGAMKKAVDWLNYFIRTEPNDVYHDEISADTWAVECMLMDMEEIK